jgi:hypothetical protein
MPKLLATQQLTAELATLHDLIERLPSDDVLTRIGLESREKEVSAELDTLGAEAENNASIALMFGGRPVIGTHGIEAAFATEAVSEFQELITNIWGAAEQGDVGSRGPVSDRDHSRLHITSLLHGSVGFLLEEVDDQPPMFTTPLKRATEEAAAVIAAFASENEEVFSEVLEAVDQRVLSSTREFFRRMYRNGATLRLVEGETELELRSEQVGRAYERAENATIDEKESPISGILLGLLPLSRKFELRSDDGAEISGSVAATLSQSYLERLREEDLVGKHCNGRAKFRRITRFGRTTEKVVLLDLVATENS